MNHLRVLLVHVLPMSLGLRLRMSGQWLVGPALGGDRLCGLHPPSRCCALGSIWYAVDRQ